MSAVSSQHTTRKHNHNVRRRHRDETRQSVSPSVPLVNGDLTITNQTTQPVSGFVCAFNTRPPRERRSGHCKLEPTGEDKKVARLLREETVH